MVRVRVNPSSETGVCVCILVDCSVGGQTSVLVCYVGVVMVRVRHERYLCWLSGSYGLPKPWYFPVTSWYWCGVADSPPRCDGSVADCCPRYKYSPLSSVDDDHQASAAAASPDVLLGTTYALSPMSVVT